MLERFLGEGHDEELKSQITRVTLGRLFGNVVYRFAPPFLPVIGRGLGVSLETLGQALTLGEMSGLSAPLVGKAIDRRPRRTSMILGMTGVTVGALMAALSPGALLFGVGLAVVGLMKIFYDVALGAWIADRVDYTRRARVVGLSELSWAGSMIIGVPLLGLIAALTSWRWSYVAGSLACGAIAFSIVRSMPSTPIPGPSTDASTPTGRLDRTSWMVVSTVGLLMASAQIMFVTFGSWLEDRFDFSTVALGTMAILLGLGELVASASTARFTDGLGKRRAVLLGAAIMAPMALVLAATEQWLVPGMIALVLFIWGFEFAIVSVFPLITELRPDARARTMGIAVGMGTIGRAVTAIPATWLYSNHGMAPAALASAAVAAVIWLVLGLGARTMH